MSLASRVANCSLLRVKNLKCVINANMASVSSSDLTVKHEPKKHRFYVQLPSSTIIALTFHFFVADISLN